MPTVSEQEIGQKIQIKRKTVGPSPLSEGSEAQFVVRLSDADAGVSLQGLNVSMGAYRLGRVSESSPCVAAKIRGSLLEGVFQDLIRSKAKVLSSWFSICSEFLGGPQPNKR